MPTKPFITPWWITYPIKNPILQNPGSTNLQNVLNISYRNFFNEPIFQILLSIIKSTVNTTKNIMLYYQHILWNGSGSPENNF